MNSDDHLMSAMAAYALGEAGEQTGFKFVEQILIKGQSNLSSFCNGAVGQTPLLQEVFKLPDLLGSAFALYDSSHYAEAKKKFLVALQIYSSEIPKLNVGYFDELVQHGVNKTRGLLYDGLAVCEFNLGNIEEALKHSLEAVTIAEEVGDSQLLKIAYADLGHFHMSLGNYYSALELLHKSLEIDDASHDPWRKKNRTLSNLAHLYYQLCNYDKALEFGQAALELSEKENDHNGRARCLNGLGVLSFTINEFQNAEEYLQEAQRLAVEELKNKALQGLILNNLAYLYFTTSGTIKTRECLSDALALAIQMSDKSAEGTVRSSLAMLDLEEGNIDNARHQAEAALEIHKKICSPAGQADAQYLLGSIEDLYSDNPIDAYEHYKESIRLTETLRENLMLDDFKITFAENQVALYQQMVSLCIRMDNTEDAFEYIERSKSRAFVDMLASISNTVDARELSSEQLEEIAALKGRIGLIRKQISESYTGHDKNASDIRHESIEAEMNNLERLYVSTFDELKMKDPEWASLVSVNVADIESVQSTMDKKTVLLELYQTSDELLVIAIEKNKPPSSVRIPIDIEAESEGLFNLFTALSSGSCVDARSHEFIRDVKKPLSHYHDLLISPIRELITDAKHLVIIPHNFWHYLPFHALYDRETEAYLIDKVSISYAPSATALNLCSRGKIQYKTALILANPSNDLPYADEEGERIRSRFAENGHFFKKGLASIDRLSEYANADVIHLACHGFFRGDEPLFSHLVLKDAEGETSPIFLPDIFNLRLSASLVTLSACETGLSQFTAGDELIGISRAFFYAGTPSLLTSLWTVNDKSTALLMERFYDGLIDRGESKAEALRTSILELKAMPEHAHPYFWAPFFLSGEWR